MKTLRQYIEEFKASKKAIGHFNISNIEGVWAVFEAAKSLNKPVIVGVSEGERNFVGVRQISAIIKSLREEYQFPIYLNADHSYSFEKVKEAIDAGFDSVIFDGAELSLDENIKITKQCVEYARSVNPEIIVEGELGFIGKSSKVLNEMPVGVSVSDEFLTKPEEARRFVDETGVDLFAPAVGNIHGVFASGKDPALNLERIFEISNAVKIPLVLHGGSGNSEEDFKGAIERGVSVVHVNTELRIAFRKALTLSLQENPDEVAPYKYLKSPRTAMQRVVEEKMKVYC